MTANISAVGPNRVSRHAGDPNKLNVIDIAPSSINLAVRKKCENAIKADPRVSKLLTPPGDPAYHIEIPQPSSAGSKMTNAWFKAVATAFLFTLSLASASAQTKCVFSDRPSDAKFENDKSVSKYTWNKDSREAKIITAGGN